MIKYSRYNLYERNQIYLQSKSSIESSHRISKPRKNPNPNLNNLVIGFCHQSCAFWRIGLNGYQLLLLGTSKSGFAKREGKDGLLMHAPIPAIFSFFFLPPFFFFLLVLFTLSFLLLSCHGLFPLFGLSFSWVPLSGCLLLSYHGFSPLSASLHWVSLFQCFFLFPCFFLLLSVPCFLLLLPSFYSKLIQWDFSLLPLGLHQLFLVCCGHPFKITHSPIGCPDHYHCSVHVCCTTTHFTTKFPFVCSCCIHLPHYLALWHASDGPNHLLLLLGKIPSQQDIFPKRSYGKKPNIDPLFPPPPNHAL